MSTASKTILSQKSIAIIKATAPTVAEHAEAITAYFYPYLFEKYPQVTAFFNQRHQASGKQQQALASALIAYAVNIDNLDVLASVVSRIVNKHVSLGVLPEHYDMVGRCLLQSIKAVLGEVATDSVITAWSEAYWQLARLLINTEESIYQSNDNKDGSWRGRRSFTVTKKVRESDLITSFYLEPTDGESVPHFLPGQYLGLKLTINGEETSRHYSLSDAPGRDYLRISVKRESGGLVSNFLHDDIAEGSRLSVMSPAGDFTLRCNKIPLVLVTAGVGITPAMSMLEHAVGSGRKILFIHAAMNARRQAFKSRVDELARKYTHVETCYVYSQPCADCHPDKVGHVDKDLLIKYLGNDRDVELYFLGPQSFMSTIYQAAESLGIPEENRHYESFGPSEQFS